MSPKHDLRCPPRQADPLLWGVKENHMAIYHMSVKPVQRSKGRSATAASAYRSAEKVKDLRTGEDFDYTRKRGVEHTEIIGSTLKRQDLWNLAESSEKRKDATTAREYEVALPKELSLDQCKKLCRDFGNELNRRHGCAADICIHAPHTDDTGTDNGNRHAHILTTTRPVTQNGTAFGSVKCQREWSDEKRLKAGLPYRNVELKEEREVWATFANKSLALANQDVRIDHRSLKDQGTNREPQIHVGQTATNMARKGKPSEKFIKNEEIKARNAELEALQVYVDDYASAVDDLSYKIVTLDDTVEPFFDFNPDINEIESSFKALRPQKPRPQNLDSKTKTKSKIEYRRKFEATKNKRDALVDSIDDLKYQVSKEMSELKRINGNLEIKDKKHTEKSFLKRIVTGKGDDYKAMLKEYQSVSNKIANMEKEIEIKNRTLEEVELKLEELESIPIVDEIRFDIEREKFLSTALRPRKTKPEAMDARETSSLNNNTSNSPPIEHGPKADLEDDQEFGPRM